jgi:hypothetical protein
VHRLRRHLTYANVMATIAVVVAVAGGSTAVAVTVNASKKSDVTKKGKIRPNRVTARKIADGNIGASELGQIQVVNATADGEPATATCPPGSRLLSGGGATAGPSNLTSSTPEGNGWRAGTNAITSVTAYALCLR